MQQREATAVPKLLLRDARRLLRRIVVDTPRLTIGRRPYNALMLDDLTVSGEHAVLLTRGAECVIQDLNSRNGTLVNGTAVAQRTLSDGDLIEIGVYRLQFVLEPPPADVPEPAPSAAAESGAAAHLLAMSGPGSGGTVPLVRAIVAIDNGVGQIAVVARRRTGYVITHLEGHATPLVNGESIGLLSRPLVDGDLLELSGAIFQFRVDPPP
jgi:hypothetical protein